MPQLSITQSFGLVGGVTLFAILVWSVVRFLRRPLQEPVERGCTPEASEAAMQYEDGIRLTERERCAFIAEKHGGALGKWLAKEMRKV